MDTQLLVLRSVVQSPVQYPYGQALVVVTQKIAGCPRCVVGFQEQTGIVRFLGDRQALMRQCQTFPIVRPVEGDFVQPPQYSEKMGRLHHLAA